MNYNKKILKISTICIIILIPLLKVLSMYLESLNIIENYDSINPAIILYVLSSVLFVLYIIEIKKSKRKLDKYDYIFYILVLAGIISTIFSINKNIAIFGKEYRHEGLLSILSYYLLFIDWKVQGNKEDVKQILKLIVIIGIINSIYSLFQVYTDLPFIIRFNDVIRVASGLCGNPNFFGSLIVTVISIISFRYLSDNEDIKKNFVIILLLFIALINAESTGPFLTYVIYLILIFIFLCKKNLIDYKKYFKLLISLIAIFICVTSINSFIPKHKNEYSLSNLEKTIFNGGNGRLDIWKKSINIVKKYPITGVGFDNFVLAYPNPKDIVIFDPKTTEREKIFIKICDNAHNVYLHTLVSTGIIGLIPYLILCLLTFLRGIKSNDKYMLMLLSGFVSYSIQAFANINVIQVAPIYFIIIGLMLSDSFDKTHV